jgi:uncharacterized protein (TIGR03435 family)
MSLVRLSLFLLSALGLLAQTAGVPLKFEVASVRQTSGILPDGRIVVGMLPPTGGPGTNDPGRIRYAAISLKMLLLKAFDVQDADLKGPSWLDNQFFEVSALMPSDTTTPQFRMMLQSLLSERFKLTLHRESKATPGYVLFVGKNGMKTKESGSKDMVLDEKWVPKVGKDGFVAPRQGQRLFIQNGPVRCRWTFQHATMQMLVGGLTTILGSPVTDATSLTKEYDFSLTFLTAGSSLQTGPGLGKDSWAEIDARSTDPAAIQAIPDIFGAVQLLGLRLERDKASKDLIVVDHIDRIPAAN